jgi:hypothetical protein
MKVLMATDGSKHATTAMTTAVRLIRKNELEADVLCVAPQLTLEHRGAGTRRGHIHDAFTEQITKQSDRILRKAHKVLHHED